MRAKLPGKSGFVDRDGVKIHYEIYGDGPETMVFLPPWTIVHSRIYKAQLPYFSERFRCITYDGRGNGKSDRPAEVAAYSLENYRGGRARRHGRDRCGKGHPRWPILRRHARLRAGRASSRARQGRDPGRHRREHRTRQLSLSGDQAFRGQAEQFEGWNKYNREYWLANYPDFAEHFIRNIYLRAALDQADRGWHRLGERDHGSRPGQDRRGSARSPPSFDVSEAMYRKIRCPMLIIHGDDDQIQTYARAQAVAEVTGAELVTIAGGGHNPLGRIPAKCNALIVDFLDRRLGIAAPAKAGEPNDAEGQASALSLVADRPRAWAARHRHHARAAQAASGSARSTGWRRIR